MKTEKKITIVVKDYGEISPKHHRSFRKIIKWWLGAYGKVLTITKFTIADFEKAERFIQEDLLPFIKKHDILQRKKNEIKELLDKNEEVVFSGEEIEYLINTWVGQFIKGSRAYPYKFEDYLSLLIVADYYLLKIRREKKKQGKGHQRKLKREIQLFSNIVHIITARLSCNVF